tara:strand:- start:2166 stop:2384 length:219 start_codon:yes stop_codon:yes gene_type:complete
MSTTTKTIKYLRGARFVDTEVQSGTISQLRTEMEIPNGASISVNGRDVTDTYELQDDDQVAAVISNKTGGNQ